MAGGGVRLLTPHGRGGSVSRRDHSQAYRRQTTLAWARKSVETLKPIPSRSSGEGVWGGGASLREAASSPESLAPLPLHFFVVDLHLGVEETADAEMVCVFTGRVNAVRHHADPETRVRIDEYVRTREAVVTKALLVSKLP